MSLLLLFFCCLLRLRSGEPEDKLNSSIAALSTLRMIGCPSEAVSHVSNQEAQVVSLPHGSC